MSPAFTLVGQGRVGAALTRCVAAMGGEPCIVGRHGPWSGWPAGPAVLCTRNDDLDVVLPKIPETHRGDLVFVQNGFLEPVLARHAVPSPTLGLLYFAATRRPGEQDVVVIGGGPSFFHGPHATTMVALLHAGGLEAVALADEQAFRAEVGVKVLWNSVFGLLGQMTGQPVGALIHHPALPALVTELVPVLNAHLHAPLLTPEVVLPRLIAYATTIAHFPASLRDLPWRNGWFQKTAENADIHTPLHTRLLGGVVSPADKG